MGSDYGNIVITENNDGGLSYSWQGPSAAPVMISYEFFESANRSVIDSIPWRLWLVEDRPWRGAAIYSRIKPKTWAIDDRTDFPPSMLGKDEAA